MPTFARIVWCGKRPTFWMTYPMVRRSSTGSAAVTSSPSIRTRPLVGSISRLIIRSTVDLPQPDGPISTASSPAPTSRLMSPTATVPSG